MMVKPIEVKPLPNYKIYLRYADGVEGEVDVSSYVGEGVFAAWKDMDFFQQVHLGPGRQIRWNEEIELCPDALYLQLTGKTPDQIFTKLSRSQQIPEISRFYGIVIRMYFRDHLPPHFHAEYGEHEALIEIETREVLEGYLPARALKLVKEWATLRRTELLRCWQLARQSQPLGQIDPLE